jgi:uncharacterized membrane protein YqiK
MEMNTSVLKQKAKPQAEIEKEMAEAAKQLGDAELVELFMIFRVNLLQLLSGNER